jgi:hypothetical protein
VKPQYEEANSKYKKANAELETVGVMIINEFLPD